MIRTVLFLIATLGLATPAQAAWRRVDAPHFSIQADLPENVLRGYAVDLEGLDALMRQLTNTPASAGRGHADILILGEVNEVRRQTGLTFFTGGITVGNPLGEVIIVAGSHDKLADFFDVRAVLFHEYAHSFMRQHLGSNQPGWFIEGYASYFEGAVPLGGGKFRYGDFPSGLALHFNEPRIVFEDIMSVSSQATGGNSPPDRIYAQGWLLTHHYFQKGPRAAEIGKYIAAVQAGQSVARPELFFKGGLPQFDTEMTAYLQKLPPPRELTVTPAPLEMISVRALRPGEAKLVDLRMRDMALRSAQLRALDKDVATWRGKRFTAAKSLLDEYPDDPAVQRFTARLALVGGDTALADKLADGLLAKAPRNIDLIALKADTLTEVARAGDARDMLAQLTRGREMIRAAQIIEPENADLAAALYRNYSAEQGASPETRKYLMRAVELNPDDYLLRRTAIDFALRTNDTKAAIALLEPIANSPHDSDMRTATIRLLADLKGGGRRPALVAAPRPARGKAPMVTVPMPPPIMIAPPAPPVAAPRPQPKTQPDADEGTRRKRR